MELLSSQKRLDWLQHRGFAVLRDGRVLSRPSAVHTFRLKLPTDGLQVIRLTNVLSTHIEGDSHPRTLFWIEEWNMWGSDVEEVGRLYAERLASAFNVPFDIDQKMALTFSEEELLPQRAFIFLPILFQWDAYMIPEHGRYFVFVCHDGFLEFGSLALNTHRKLKEALQAWDPVG